MGLLFSFRHPFTIIRKYNGGSPPKKRQAKRNIKTGANPILDLGEKENENQKKNLGVDIISDINPYRIRWPAC